MAFTPAVVASLIYRDYIVDGVPASGKHRPVKSQIRIWCGEVEAYLSGHDTQIAALDTRLDAEEATSVSLGSRLDTAEASIVTLLARPVIPTGVVLMWSGAVGAIPAGWALCDGTNGTPDLRGRFVVGAGGSYSVGNTGGQESITQVPAHTHAHTLAVESDGAHTHGVTDPGHLHTVDRRQKGGSAGSAWGQDSNAASDVVNTSGVTTGISIQSGGAHTHGLTGAITSAGNASVDVRPPYYALCYIMKT